MFSPFSLISSIKVQEVHPQRCPPAKPELTFDILRIKKAGKTTKPKGFQTQLIHNTEGKKKVHLLLLKKNVLFCFNCKL